ncbi:exonuclease domain-containing protein [Mycoplasma sp. CSL10166]|uniref:exonuclease domain-containing protein n=1 Tax=Mycoplasma sp. CSL10166 TaxID=2813825 RepID=UPI00197BA287|nr:exonuclease domain-containing protein [Mycoplasma sp. CSL10166]MBN4084214.1 AAA family ATPase [Mycoplasma sp. CSL10166]
MKKENKNNELSLEQRKIINSFYGDNLIVNAAAGSGKTRVIVEIIYESNKYNLNSKILVLSYNTKLVNDTKIRILKKDITIKNCDIHTFHSFATKKSKKIVMDDLGLKEFNESKILTVDEYDTIIIDEAQDITPLYWVLILKILKYNAKARVMFIGDSNQEIYNFKKASSMFLENIDKLIPSKTWKKLEINGSFRVPNATWRMLKESKQYKSESFNALNKEGILKINAFEYKDKLFEETIVEKIHQYGQENIFVLSNTTNINIIRDTANKLTLKGFKVYVSRSDNEEKVDFKEMHGKIVFSSVHQVKGLERKIVIIINLDGDVQKKYTIDEFNKLFYVAATRNIEELHIFFNKNRSLPTLMEGMKDQIDGWIDYENDSSDEAYNIKKATEIIKFIPIEIEEELKSLIDISEINKKDEIIKISNIITYDGFFYDISDINGIYAEQILGNDNLDEIKKINRIILNFFTMFNSISKETHQYIEKIINKEFNSFLELCFIKHSIETNDITRLKHFEDNINNFPTWIDKENHNKIYSRMQKYLSKSNFEQQIGVNWDNKILGIIDFYQKYTNEVHEIKFVSNLSLTHFFQVAVYLLILYKTSKNKNIPVGYLLNIKDNMRYKITINDFQKFEIILLKILDGFNNEISVEEFINLYNENQLNILCQKTLMIKEYKENVPTKIVNKIKSNKKSEIKQKYNKIVFFDTETTSLQGEIIQLSLVVYENEIKVDEINFYFKNDLRIHRQAYLVHKISDEFLINKPKFYEEFNKIYKYLTGDYLWIAHNAAFDIYRLFFNFKYYSENIGDKLENVKFNYLCSFNTMKKNVPGLKSYKLENLAKEFGLEMGKFHDSLFDAQTIVKLLKKVDDSIEGYINSSLKNGYKIKTFNYVEWSRDKK